MTQWTLMRDNAENVHQTQCTRDKNNQQQCDAIKLRKVNLKQHAGKMMICFYLRQYVDELSIYKFLHKEHIKKKITMGKGFRCAAVKSPSTICNQQCCNNGDK